MKSSQRTELRREIRILNKKGYSKEYIFAYLESLGYCEEVIKKHYDELVK